MLTTIRNAWKIPELRRKLLFTLVIILLYRIGNVIPVPGVNVQQMSLMFSQQLSNTIFGLFDMIGADAALGRQIGQTAGVAALAAAHYHHGIHLGSDAAGLFLAFAGGITNGGQHLEPGQAVAQFLFQLFEDGTVLGGLGGQHIGTFRVHMQGGQFVTAAEHMGRSVGIGDKAAHFGMVGLTEKQQLLAVAGGTFDGQLGALDLGTGGVHHVGAGGADGLLHLTGDAVGADEDPVRGVELGRILSAEDLQGLIVGQDLRVVDDGAQGAGAAFAGLFQSGIQFLQGQADPHAETGGLGADDVHSSLPEKILCGSVP